MAGSLWYANLSESLSFPPAPSQQPIRLSSGHTSFVNQLALHPTRDLVATASSDGSLRFWTGPGSLQQIVAFHSPGQYCLCAQFNLTGPELLAAGYSHGVVRFINVPEMKVIKAVQPADPPEAITALSFANEGRLLICGTAVGSVFTIDTSTWEVTKLDTRDPASIPIPTKGRSNTKSSRPVRSHSGARIDSIHVSELQPSLWLVTDSNGHMSVWNSSLWKIHRILHFIDLKQQYRKPFVRKERGAYVPPTLALFARDMPGVILCSAPAEPVQDPSKPPSPGLPSATPAILFYSVSTNEFFGGLPLLSSPSCFDVSPAGDLAVASHNCIIRTAIIRYERVGQVPRKFKWSVVVEPCFRLSPHSDLINCVVFAPPMAPCTKAPRPDPSQRAPARTSYLLSASFGQIISYQMPAAGHDKRQ